MFITELFETFFVWRELTRNLVARTAERETGEICVNQGPILLNLWLKISGFPETRAPKLRSQVIVTKRTNPLTKCYDLQRKGTRLLQNLIFFFHREIPITDSKSKIQNPKSKIQNSRPQNLELFSFFVGDLPPVD